MPDIREILNALSVDNRALWSEQRTIMRRAYLNAHNETVGIGNWTHEDDAFMDLIDIRLALLFDRAGLLNSTKEIIGDTHIDIEHDIKKREDDMKDRYVQVFGRANRQSVEPDMSEASKLLQNDGWK